MNENFSKIKGKDLKINLVNLSQLVFEVTDASQEAFGRGRELRAGSREQGAGGEERRAKGKNEIN